MKKDTKNIVNSLADSLNDPKFLQESLIEAQELVEKLHNKNKQLQAERDKLKNHELGFLDALATMAIERDKLKAVVDGITIESLVNYMCDVNRGYCVKECAKQEIKGCEQLIMYAKTIHAKIKGD